MKTAVLLQIVGLSLFLGVMTGCRGSENDRILALAEGYVEHAPDSAVRLLEKWNEVGENSDNQRAKYALIYTQALHKCHRLRGNDSLINVAVEHYTRKGERPLAAKAWLYKGLVHKQRNEVEQAATAFAQSEQWFEGVEDDQYKALLYNHFGDLMYNQANYEEALDYFKLSYRHYLKGDSIHYTASACGVIAGLYKCLEQPDSARAYYEKGLAYEGQIPKERWALLVQSYANFLKSSGEHERAEELLLGCVPHVTGGHVYPLCSSLASLYYEMKEYEKARGYAERMMESEDSLMLRGGCLLLYGIYTKMGDKEKGQEYYARYRHYDSDIRERMKSAEVAAIPHEVATQVMTEKHWQGERRLWMMTAGSTLVVAVGIAAFVDVRRRHRRRQQALQTRLTEEQVKHTTEMEKMRGKESEHKQTIGLQGYWLAKKEERIEKLEREHRKKLEREKTIADEKKMRVDELEEKHAALKAEKRKLEVELGTSVKENRRLKSRVEELEHEGRIKERIDYFVHKGADKRELALLQQLKWGRNDWGIKLSRNEYAPLLTALLARESAEVRERIDRETNNPAKRIICYLLALGLNDEEMIYRATDLRMETIRKYIKECE